MKNSRQIVARKIQKFSSGFGQGALRGRSGTSHRARHCPQEGCPAIQEEIASNGANVVIVLKRYHESQVSEVIKREGVHVASDETVGFIPREVFVTLLVQLLPALNQNEIASIAEGGFGN